MVLVFLGYGASVPAQMINELVYFEIIQKPSVIRGQNKGQDLREEENLDSNCQTRMEQNDQNQ